MGYGFNTFDGGVSGTNFTVANSGGVNGSASDTLVVNNVAANGGNAAIQYSTDAALEGPNGLRLTLAATTTYARWSDPTPGPRGGFRRPFHFTGAPTAQLDLGSIRSEGGGPLSDSAGAAMLTLVVTTTGRVAIGPAGTNDAASLYALTAGQRYWFEVFAEKGTTAANGKAWLRVYAADGITVLHDYVNNACNTRSSNAWQFRFGGGTTASGYTIDNLDSIQFGAKSSGFFGPLVSAPEIASFTISTAGEPGSTATATATLAPSSPVADSWTFTQTAGPAVALSGTGATRTFQIPYVPDATGADISISVTATAGGLTDTALATAHALCHTFWWRDGGSWLPVLF